MKYKVAIIGCGRISYKHVQAIADNQNNMDLVAVCDVIEQRAQEKAEKYTEFCNNNSPKVYTDYKKLLLDEHVDIVAIATESGYHSEQAIYCMNKGKHVIVEKPMALSTVDARAMVLASKSNKVHLAVCHQNRFNPPVQKLRQAIEEGRFGKIIAGTARILWYRDESYYKQALWRGTYKWDGGCLMNQCIHNIDLLQWMMGSEIDFLNGLVGNYAHHYIEAEDYGSIQIKFKNGSIGNIEGTVCTYPSNLEETLTIIGEKGTVVIGGLAVNKIKTWHFADNLDDEKEIMAIYNADVENVYGSGHTPLYKDFIGAIENNTKPYIDGVDGMKAIEIILGAYQSNKEENRIYYPIGNVSTLDFI